MIKFKKDNKVVCVDASFSENITVGNVYKVVDRELGYKDTTIFIINDNGRRDYFNDIRFISVIEYRSKTIDSILK